MTKGKVQIQIDSNTDSSRGGVLQKTRMVTSIDDIQSMKFWKAVMAEFLGTLLLVFIACGSCITLTEATKPSITQIALCFGLSVATIVWNIAHVSGGHINPAVTIGMLVTRKISLAKACFYILFQLVGAIVGAGILLGVTPVKSHGTLGMTLVSDEINVGQAIGIEFLITFILVFTVFASCDGKRKDIKGSIPLSIGLSVTMCHLFAIQYTGASMNVARTFGPAVVMGIWENHWVYWLGPLLGGLVAGLLYDNIFAVNSSISKTKACLFTCDYDDANYQAQKTKLRILEEERNEQLDQLNHDGNQKHLSPV